MRLRIELTVIKNTSVNLENSYFLYHFYFSDPAVSAGLSNCHCALLDVIDIHLVSFFFCCQLNDPTFLSEDNADQFLAFGVDLHFSIMSILVEPGKNWGHIWCREVSWQNLRVIRQQWRDQFFLLKCCLVWI